VLLAPMCSGHCRGGAYGLTQPLRVLAGYFLSRQEYDYDPVWAKCIELKVAPDLPFVLAWVGAPAPRSPILCTTTSAHFAARPKALCKALFFRRGHASLPQLRFAFWKEAWAGRVVCTVT